MTMKLCPKCKQDKELIFFYKNKGLKLGVSSWCIDCLKEYYHSDLNKKRRSEYFQKNKKSILVRRGNTRKKLRLDVIEILGGKCLFCGFTDIRALQIDHIDGKSINDRVMRTSTPTTYYKKVIKDSGKNYQLLCANCNWIKRSKNGEF